MIFKDGTIPPFWVKECGGKDRHRTGRGPRSAQSHHQLSITSGEGKKREEESQLFLSSSPSSPTFFGGGPGPQGKDGPSGGQIFFASVLSFLVEKLVSYESNEDHEETFGTDITCTI